MIINTSTPSARGCMRLFFNNFITNSYTVIVKLLVYMFIVIACTACIYLQGMEAPQALEQPLLAKLAELKITTLPIKHLLQDIKIPAKDTRIGTIQLKSANGKEFTIPLSVARFSQTLNGMLEDIGAEHPIALATINDALLSTIVSSLKNLHTITQNSPYYDAQKLAQALDRIFIDMPLNYVLEVFKIANYLDIPVLLDYISVLIAAQFSADTKHNAQNFAQALSTPGIIPSEVTKIVKEWLKKSHKAVFIKRFARELDMFMPSNSIMSLAISPDNKYALIGFDRAQVKVFDRTTGQLLRTFRGDTGHITFVKFTSDSKCALTTNITPFAQSNLANSIRLWDIHTGETVKTFKFPISYNNSVSNVTINKDNTYALTASHHNPLLTVWSLDLNLSQAEHELTPVKALTVQPGALCSSTLLALNANGQYALARSNFLNEALFWDLSEEEKVLTPTKILTTQTEKENGFRAAIESLAISHNGNYALIGLSNGILQCWDLKIGKPVESIAYGTGSIRAITFSSSGTFALICTKILTIFDIVTGQHLKDVSFWPHHFPSLVAISDNEDYALVSVGSSVVVCGLLDAFNTFTLDRLVDIIKTAQEARS